MTTCDVSPLRESKSSRLEPVRVRELAQIAAGLAHEIRNPLHALRINLHALRRSFTSRTPLPQEQIIATLRESDTSIDCLNQLMGDLLHYVDPSAGEPAEVDLVYEVRAALSRISDDLRRDQITVQTSLQRDGTVIAIDPIRLRQALVAVFTFARHRAGRSGAIEVRVERFEGGVQIAVGDSGPEMHEEQQIRLFEPFQAPADTGSGLGLALVPIYVEEAGGRVEWVSETGRGGYCRLWFPIAQRESKGERS